MKNVHFSIGKKEGHLLFGEYSSYSPGIAYYGGRSWKDWLITLVLPPPMRREIQLATEWRKPGVYGNLEQAFWCIGPLAIERV